MAARISCYSTPSFPDAGMVALLNNMSSYKLEAWFQIVEKTMFALENFPTSHLWTFCGTEIKSEY